MNLLDKLNQYRVAKNTSVLAVSQLLSRVASVFYVTALARYVGSGGIGQISTANSINSILLLIAGPGLAILFVRDVAPKPERAASYVVNTLMIRVILFFPFVLATFLVSSTGRYPADTVNIIHLYTLVYLLDSATEILICVFRSYERMEYEGGLQIARDVTNVVLSLLAIYLGWSLYAIVAMSLVAQVVKLVLALRLVSRRIARPELRLDLRLSKDLFLTSLPFGLLLIIQTFEAELGTFILSLYYSASVVGVFAAANTLITMLLLIPNSFSSAIFPNIARMYHRSVNELREFYRLSFKYLLMLGFPLGLGTILVGERAILLIYGDAFTGSAVPVAIMAVFLFTIVGYSNGPVLQATGRQRFFAWTEGVAALTQAILCFWLVPTMGAVGAALAFTIGGGMVTFFIHSAACHRQLGLPMPWSSLLRIVLATAIMGIVVELGLQIGISWLIVSTIIAMPVYFAVLLALRVLSRSELRTLAGEAPASQISDVAVASVGD